MQQEKRLTRSSRDKVVAGVCAGLANYINVDPLLVRLLFVVLILGGEGIFIYGILYLIMPESDEALDVPRTIELYRPQQGRQIAGVCAGLAEYFNFDVNIIRVIFILAGVTGGTGALLYILLAMIIPEEPIEYEKPKRTTNDLTA